MRVCWRPFPFSPLSSMATTHRWTRSKTPGDRNKVIGYVRVSTGDQALGPEAQRRAMLAWCEAQRCKMIDVFCDHAVGGAAPADQRPGLSAALAGVKQHGAGILLVATRDRLARDTLVAALVEQRGRGGDVGCGKCVAARVARTCRNLRPISLPPEKT